jgi:putative ABC transport system permease protein
MNALAYLTSLVGTFFQRDRVDEEMDEEFRAHIQRHADDLERSGVPRAEAERRARMAFGAYERTKEQCREEGAGFYMESLWKDIRFGLRMLYKNPGFTAVAVLTLALGIGANAAIFSVVRGVLLRPLNNQDEDRLLYIRQTITGDDDVGFSVPEIKDIGANLKTIKELGTLSSIDFTVVGLGEPREISAGVVDGTYFDVMGLKPVLGRLLNPGDDGPSAPGAAVLTYRFWTSSLHSDPSVIGKVIRLGSAEGARSATIVGVVEPSVPYPAETQIIANIVTSPHHLSATMVQGRVHRMTGVFARLAPGAELESARAELNTVYAGMLAAHPEVYRPNDHYQIAVTRMHEQINSRANTILWVLFAASGLLFVIACSNVANLFLARTVRREPELALRAALGATRAVLRRSLLAEALVLCVTGLLAGVLIAAPMVSVLGRYAARFSARAVGLTLDSSLLWIGVVLALIAAVFLAFVPRLPSGDASRGFGISSSSVRVTGGSKRRLRIFAVTQITASFLLLAGAGALLRTLLVLQHTQPPFQSARVLSVNLPVMSDGRTPEQLREFYREVQRRAAATPGIERTAIGFATPWRDARFLNLGLTFAIQGAAKENALDDPRARFRPVSSGFFETMGMPILEGRDFDEHDRAGSELVVIVNQSVANQLFPGQDPLNRELRWTDPVVKFIGISYEPRRIIGVVPDFDDQDLIPSSAMTIYQPTEQEGWESRLFVRAKNDPYLLVPTITREIHEIAADQPVEHPSTLDDIRAEVMTPDRLNAVVFGGFASLALLISVVGVAGVLAFSVSGRTREFGIRLALGAKPTKILADVLIEGLIMASIGVAIGALVGFTFTHSVGKYIADLQVPGGTMLLASAVLILAAALIASAVPAARAAKVDAVQALRSE